MKKILLFMIFIALTLPASAWEESFENHEADEDVSLFTGDFQLRSNGESSTFIGGHGNWEYAYSVGAYEYLYIEKPFDGYLAFDLFLYSVSSQKMTTSFNLYDENDSSYLSQIYIDYTFTGGQVYRNRLEFIENTAGTGVDYYWNGVSMGSASYLSDSVPGKIKIGVKTPSTLYAGIDNIVGTPTFSMIGCDAEYTSLDTYQYYMVGYPHFSNGYMYTKIYDPENTVIQIENVSIGTEYSIPSTLIDVGGTYSIKLYKHDNVTGKDYYFGSRNFVFDQPSEYVILLDSDKYSPSDTIRIYTFMPEYASGYKVSISYKTASGVTAYTYDVTLADQTKNWVLPSMAEGGSFFAYFRDPNDNVVAFDSFEIIAPLGTTDLYLDKDIYEKNDTVKIAYKYLPENTDITLILRSGTTNVYTESWRDLSGSGVIIFDLEGRAADSLYIKAVNSNAILKEDEAEILSGNGFISGKVYDSSTNTPVSGATVYIGGSSSVTNALGYYEMTVLMGTQPVSIILEGYNQYTGNVQIFSLSTTRNFYIVKTISSGSNTLYGTVTDYYTGSPLTGTYIQIQNGSTIYSMLTHSKTGNYLFDQEGLSGSWEVTVTKTGYDTHTETVNIEGDTFRSIKLVPIGGSSSIPDDDSSDSGTGSSNSSTDRPGRKAAQESMEQFEALAPALIAFVVLKVMREVMK